MGLIGGVEAFPLQFDPVGNRVGFVDIRPEQFESFSFLDARIANDVTPIRWASFAEVEDAVRQLAVACDFIFHIGHVGSTLLSRLLGLQKSVFSLREPDILRSLATGLNEAQLTVFLKLFSRTPRPNQRTLLKATSFVSQIAGPMMRLAPSGRAILLFVSPLTYLATILGGDASRKELVAQAPARLARLRERLEDQPWPAETLSPGALAAMTWTSEIMSLVDLAEELPAQVCWLDFDVFLADPGAGLAKCLCHLHGRYDPPDVATMLSSPHMRSYSKAEDHPFDAAMRSQGLDRARRDFAGDIEAGVAWLKVAAHAHPNIDAAFRRVAAARGL